MCKNNVDEDNGDGGQLTDVAAWIWSDSIRLLAVCAGGANLRGARTALRRDLAVQQADNLLRFHAGVDATGDDDGKAEQRSR
jgi:hypothetical protein